MLVTKATAQIQDNLFKLGLVHSSIWVLYVSLKYDLILKHLLPIFGVLMYIKVHLMHISFCRAFDLCSSLCFVVHIDIAIIFSSNQWTAKQVET